MSSYKQQAALRPGYQALKRGLDILIAGTAAILLAPVIALVALLIRLRLGSPVIFRAQRPGLHEAIFDCLKFRSMTSQCDANGKLLPDEQRLTPFGKMLRRLSLDELPQLWNVLAGEMSLVGPRPLEVRYLARYSAEQNRRHSVRPGVTGWSQINGRNAIDWELKLALDVWYVDHASIWLDLKILAMTAWKVVGQAGVAQAGYVSGPEFQGTASAEECASTSMSQSSTELYLRQVHK